MNAYEAVAKEYYDPGLHPTCAALRDLSLQAVNACVLKLPTQGVLVEIGAGDSILAPIALKGEALHRVVLLDGSETMLTYSQKWGQMGAKLQRSDASETSLQSSSAALVIASLGDPYNTPSFWDEMRRVLRPDGRLVFTSPAHEWSSRFRLGGKDDVAEFVTSNGKKFEMPSFVYPYKEQLELIGRSGLSCREYFALTVSSLSGRTPPKLSLLSNDTPAVACYDLVLRE
ncbi:class I SAM-dependent methyltransferase [Shimia haliotis]|uniref:SAM-dependent methyltransferase n=1 Tax=Shimia haliotis TaxID=1280847 RepID=A0A1I4H5Y9_9RHOB|nr:class I SAM-dependent methyltransferase [Shimia haliotis]SFL36811.1 SAM-dependent methyltransferase [Shimia haliotis]